MGTNVCRVGEISSNPGNIRVPLSNRELAGWIWRQRGKRIAGKLSQDHIRRLDRLGFRWEPREP